MKWQKKSIDSRAAAGKISKYFNIKFGVFLVDENYRKKTRTKYFLQHPPHPNHFLWKLI
jgi:hypothetical protein